MASSRDVALPRSKMECNEWAVVSLGKKMTPEKRRKEMAQPEIGNQIVYLEIIKRIVYNVLGPKHSWDQKAAGEISGHRGALSNLVTDLVGSSTQDIICK